MTTKVITGNLRKLKLVANQVVEYYLILAQKEATEVIELSLNQYLGCKVSLQFTGIINCVACNRLIKKTFNQGYCYPCFMRLAECDNCIINPHKCHYHLGSCRDEAWGLNFCFAPHIVYLATTSQPKVGITRLSQVPTRWLDQGAVQALPILQTSSRYQAGLVERILASSIAERTNWKKMLGPLQQDNYIVLDALRDALLIQHANQLAELKLQFGDHAITEIANPEIFKCEFPVLSYPMKIISLTFDKTPIITGELLGLKGQYLLFDTGVINLRNFTVYNIIFSD